MNETFNSLATAKVINRPTQAALEKAVNAVVFAKVSNSAKRAALEKAKKAVASASDSHFTPGLIESLQYFCKSGYPGRIYWIDNPLGATNDPEEKVKLLEALAGSFRRNTNIARSVAEDIQQARTSCLMQIEADAIEL